MNTDGHRWRQPRRKARRRRQHHSAFYLCSFVFICGSLFPLLRGTATPTTIGQPRPASLARPDERHLRNVRQLTFGGENAEAYFSADGKRLIFQSTRDGNAADQIYIMKIDGSGVRRVSTGKGRCTCSYFFPDGRRILYSSTHLAGDAPPPPPDRSHGYVWAVYPSYDIFTARPDGSDLQRLTDNPGYDAEATISPRGDRIVFTSLRDGDLDLYTMDRSGKDVRRLTRALGYDGGAFFSPDGRQIVFRAYRPRTEEQVREYRDLLARHLIRPTTLELFVMNADGTNERQVTHNGAANFCPFFTPDGKRIIFASNLDDPQGRNFDLYLIRTDGTGLERITTDPTFDGFPMFSPDGKKLVWAANRNGRERGETNIFIADWVD
jgi:TolB protein